jgi:hypothetical protein
LLRLFKEDGKPLNGSRLNTTQDILYVTGSVIVASPGNPHEGALLMRVNTQTGMRIAPTYAFWFTLMTEGDVPTIGQDIETRRSGVDKVYMTGMFKNGDDFDGFILASYNIFFCDDCFDTTFGTDGHDSVNGIAVDPGGNVYVVGSFATPGCLR